MRRIALMRGGGLGDTILALPALAELRSRFPAAAISWVGEPLHRELLLDRGLGVDEVITLPSQWQQESLVTAEFIKAMQERRFDLAIQLHGGGRQSNPFLTAWKPGLSLGMATADAAPLDISIAYQPWQHEVHRFVDVIRQLDGGEGAREVPTPSLPLTEAEASGDLLDLLVVHPGARDPRRRWSPESFVSVLRTLDLPTVLIGSADERGVCGWIAERTAAVDLSGALDLSTMIRLIAHARLLLANDSGPRHVAEAVGTPSVSIYWVGNLINAGPLSRARHTVQVSWQMQCPRCGTSAITVDGTGMSTCGHLDSWVDAIPSEAVIADIDRMWQESDQRPRRISLMAGRTSSR